ncbi:MAG: DNA cytosine methyltransferase [Gammaproteobacteria bacterium]|nr:DNA cytosine methyltransferase [Gammaproteobacteria bacterium]
MSNLTHIDLFTGIGGFTLACHWNGIQTDVMCEIDERCRQFLERTWPGIPIIPDIREFDGSRWRGRFLLTGGVPCQPASRAGKQRGKDDDRWLWPETLRIVSEARPHWVLFENPLGIDDVGLGGILADLEAQGYEVAPPLIIPACAVNAPQLRKRYWIVGHRLSEHGKKHIRRNQLQEKSIEIKVRGTSQSHMADTECLQRTSWRNRKTSINQENGNRQATDSRSANANWNNSLWLPCADGKVRRAPDDTFGVVNGLHRSLLAGLGNSIVPQVAYEIIKAIKKVEVFDD